MTDKAEEIPVSRDSINSLTDQAQIWIRCVKELKAERDELRRQLGWLTDQAGRDSCAGEISRLCAERDLARRALKAVIAELTPENECTAACDSYGHAEDCRATSALAEFRAMRVERGKLRDENLAMAQQLATLRAFVVEVEARCEAGCECAATYRMRGQHAAHSLCQLAERARELLR